MSDQTDKEVQTTELSDKNVVEDNKTDESVKDFVRAQARVTTALVDDHAALASAPGTLESCS